jgi:hypothetical protein
MKIICTLSLFFSLNLFASESLVRYEFVPVIKDMLIQKAIQRSDQNKSTAYEYIKRISQQAIQNIKHNDIPEDLSQCVSEIKFDLEQSNIYLSHQEIVETLIAAINS